MLINFFNRNLLFFGEKSCFLMTKTEDDMHSASTILIRNV